MYLCIFRIPVLIPYLLLSTAYLLKRLRFLHEKMYNLSYSQKHGLCSQLKNVAFAPSWNYWWMTRFYVLFKSISVIFGRWQGDNERLSAMDLGLRLKWFQSLAIIQSGTAKTAGQRIPYWAAGALYPIIFLCPTWPLIMNVYYLFMLYK